MCTIFHVDSRLPTKDNATFIIDCEFAHMTTFRRQLLLLLGCLLASIPAWAGPIWEVGKTGKVIYHQDRGPVSGFGLSITQLIFGSQDIKVRSGHFAFTTGSLIGFQPGTELFGSGGKFVLRGCVDGDGNRVGWCDRKDIRGTLISGTFLNAKLVQENGQWVLIAELVEEINPALAALLHESTTSDAMLELTLSGSPEKRCWTVDGVTGGSIKLLSEPASILILTASLIGLWSVLIARRLRQRAMRASP